MQDAKSIDTDYELYKDWDMSNAKPVAQVPALQRLQQARKKLQKQSNQSQELLIEPDSQIDYSDIPEATDWSGAIQESVVSSSRDTPRVLDADVAQWLSTQDAETKRHINEVIRHIMVLQQV